MNTKELYTLANKMAGDDFEFIWLWQYPNGQVVWATVEKSRQLDAQRKENSHATMSGYNG